MTTQSTRKIRLLAGLITGLLAFNSQAETTHASTASDNITYESSLSGFKSINDEAAKVTANDSMEDMKGMDHSKMDHSKMDHSKMSADEMKDMPGMDHSKMKPDEMKGMDHSKMDHSKMDHSKMSADEMKDMKAAPKAASKPAKVKKSKPSKNMAKPASPATANPHQNHQM